MSTVLDERTQAEAALICIPASVPREIWWRLAAALSMHLAKTDGRSSFVGAEMRKISMSRTHVLRGSRLIPARESRWAHCSRSHRITATSALLPRALLLIATNCAGAATSVKSKRGAKPSNACLTPARPPRRQPPWYRKRFRPPPTIRIFSARASCQSTVCDPSRRPR